MKKLPGFDNSMDESEYENMFRNEETHGWYRGMKSFSDVLLERYLLRKTGLRVLDVGCGTGAMMVFLKKYGKTYGIDTSADAIKFCQKRNLKDAKVADATYLPFANNKFDLVTCFDVLNISGVNFKKAFFEVYRVLDHGGIYLLRLPAFNFLRGEHDLVVHSVHRFTRNELENELKNYGFKILFCTYANTLLFPPILFLRWLSRCHKGGSKLTSDVKQMPRLLNLLLEFSLWFESKISKYASLPFGVSVFVVARKV